MKDVPKHSDSSEVTPSPVSGTRLGTEELTDAPWRGLLLDLAMELPHAAPLAELSDAFLNGLEPVLPGVALRVQVDVSGSAPFEARRGSRSAQSDEHRCTLTSGGPGSGLYVGRARAGEALSAREKQIVERAALIFDAAIARAQGFARIQELKSRLMQAEKLASLGKVVASIVHELNNPLTSILAYTSQLNQRLSARCETDPTGDLERVHRIAESADRVLKFTRGLVEYARPTSELWASVRLDEIVDKALFFCDHEFVSSGVSVERAYPEGLSPLRGAADQLTQVFVNLFTNAAHAMRDRGGRLQIVATPSSGGETLVVDVIDTGTGVAAELLPRIFEPFYTTKTAGQGTGLGLSIVHDIVRAHGGTISVESGPDGGTTFRLSLPLAREASA